MPLRTDRRTVCFVAVAALCAVLLCPSSVFAWEISKATNGVIVSRSVEDTSTGGINIGRYWGYLGGEDWTDTKPPNWGSSYSASKSYVFDGTEFEALEVPLTSGYRCQLITVSQTGRPARAFALLNDRLNVSLPSTQSVSIGASSTIAVSNLASQTATMSVVGTLPVAVTGIGRMDSEFLTLVGVLCVCTVAAGGGWAFMRWHR